MNPNFAEYPNYEYLKYLQDLQLFPTHSHINVPKTSNSCPDYTTSGTCRASFEYLKQKTTALMLNVNND